MIMGGPTSTQTHHSSHPVSKVHISSWTWTQISWLGDSGGRRMRCWTYNWTGLLLNLSHIPAKLHSTARNNGWIFIHINTPFIHREWYTLPVAVGPKTNSKKCCATLGWSSIPGCVTCSIRAVLSVLSPHNQKLILVHGWVTIRYYLGWAT